MRTRKPGNTDMELTTVGLGTWAIGGPWEYGWGPQDDQNSIDAILKALETGINWIDTAPAYGGGHSEKVIGMAIKQTDYKPYLATKCGSYCDENGQLANSLDKQHIFDQCRRSLDLLGVDTVDLLQMHWPLPEEDIEKGWEAMAECVESGWTRHIGVSNFSVGQIEKINSIYPVESLQPKYSMLSRDIENQMLPYCQQNNIGVVCYSPMQMGLLTGKFSHEYVKNLAEDDIRRRFPPFQEPRFSIYLELVEKLRSIAERNEKTMPQLAVAWVLRRPEVTAAIVGARRPDQIEETAQAGDWEINADDLTKISDLLEDCQKKIEEATAQNVK